MSRTASVPSATRSTTTRCSFKLAAAFAKSSFLQVLHVAAFPATALANNPLAAVLDSHIHSGGNKLGISSESLVSRGTPGGIVGSLIHKDAAPLSRV